MKIEIQDKDPNVKQLDLTLETADIGPKIKSELNKIRAKTDIKGFRKGKTPLSFIKRTYGKQVAIEVISEKSQEALYTYIEDNKIDLINQPLLLHSQIPAIEDGGLDETCEFSWLLGIMPELDLSGISSSDAYDYFELKVGEDKIDERMEMMRKQLGRHEHPDNIQENDILEIDIEELDGDKIKEDGHDSNFRFAVDLIADDELKSKILTLGPDDTFDFDIYQLERHRNDEYVHKYFLKLEDDENADEINNNFRATIARVHRHIPPELNDEFFEKGFPDGVSNEAEARSEIASQYVKGYASVGDNMLLKKIIDTVEAENSFELPESYLVELIKSNNKEYKEEDLENLRKSVRRQIIISIMIKKLNIEITQDDLREKVMQEFTANFGGMTLPPETIEKIVGNALNDEKYTRELSDRVLNEKLINRLKVEVKLDRKSLPEDELMKLYDETFPKPESDEEE